MKKKNSKLPPRIIFIGFLCLAAIVLALYFPLRYLTNSVFFQIRDSVYFCGENIFSVNLDEQARRLTLAYPNYKSIVIHRVLPDRINVDFIPRQAVALVNLSENFYVDGEGVLFQPSVLPDNNSQLPVIVGLGRRIPVARAGAKYSEDSLQAILGFLNDVSNDENLSSWLKIKNINLANAGDIFLFLDSGCKINLGSSGSLDKDLLALQMLIDDLGPDIAEIEYIDLRFREPVVKYK
ncbi:cell division protein FtsQ/DivIB [Candidatus Omnitrophota bacterium]